MAITYVGKSYNGTTAGTTIAVTKPTGLADGDVMVAVIHMGGTTTSSGAPAGWTAPYAYVNNSTCSHALYYKVVTDAAGEAASYSFTRGGTDDLLVNILVYRGVDTSTPLDVTPVYVANSSSTTATIPAITTVTNGAWVIAYIGLGSGSTALVTPGALTEREANTTYRHNIGDIELLTAGTSGPYSQTIGAARNSIGAQVALRPGASGPTTIEKTVPQVAAISVPVLNITRTVPEVAAIKTINHVRTVTQAFKLQTTTSRTVGESAAVKTIDHARTVTQVAALNVAGVFSKTVPQVAAIKTVGHTLTVSQSFKLRTTASRTVGQTASIVETETNQRTVPQVAAIEIVSNEPLAIARKQGGLQNLTNTSHSFTISPTVAGQRLVALISMRSTSVSVTGVTSASGTWSFLARGTNGSAGTASVEAWECLDASLSLSSLSVALDGSAPASLILIEMTGTDLGEASTAGSGSDTGSNTDWIMGPWVPAAGDGMLVAGMSGGSTTTTREVSATTAGWSTAYFFAGSSVLSQTGETDRLATPDGLTAYEVEFTGNGSQSNGWVMVLVPKGAGSGASSTSRTVPQAAAISVETPSGTGEVTFVTSVSGGSSSSTSVSLLKPVGMQAGDVMVAIMTLGGNPTTSVMPPEWTVVVPHTVNSTVTVVASYRVVVDPDAEPASYTFERSSSDDILPTILVYRGVDTTNPIDVTPVVQLNPSSTTAGIPAITPFTAGSMVVAYLGLGSSSTLIEVPVGMDQRHFNTTYRHFIADYTAETVQAYGPYTQTIELARLSIGFQIALRPSAVSYLRRIVPQGAAISMRPVIVAAMSVALSRTRDRELTPVLNGAVVVGDAWSMVTGNTLTFPFSDEPVADIFDTSRTFHAIGDLHFGDSLASRRLDVYNDTTANLNTRNARRIFTGDLSDHGTTAERNDSKAWMDSMGTDYKVVFGNHDFYSSTPLTTLQTHYARTGNWFEDFGTDIRLIGLSQSTANDTPTLTTATLDWMEARLSETERTCILFAHSPLWNSVQADPLYPGSISSTESIRYIRPWPNVLDRLGAHPNAKAWIAGHLHCTVTAPQFLMAYPVPGGGTIASIQDSSIQSPGRGTDTYTKDINTVFITVYANRLEVRIRDHKLQNWTNKAGQLVWVYPYDR